jgi:hypothetical protein
MPANPGGRQPLSAHVIQTANCRLWPSSRPQSDTITSVDTVLLQAVQTAINALLSFAFSLGILPKVPEGLKHLNRELTSM